MESRETRLKDDARYCGWMAVMWAVIALGSGAWGYAAYLNEEGLIMCLLICGFLLTSIFAISQAGERRRNLRLLWEHRHFLKNMKPTVSV